MMQLLRKRSRCPSAVIGITLRGMSTVMSFGDASHGALGLPQGIDAYEPSPIPGLPPDVCGVAAGHYHSLAVTSSGHVWAWGRNSETQLGRGLLSPRQSWNNPLRVEGLNQVRVQAAFASGVTSAAIGDDGSMWVWGKSKRGQLGLGEDICESVLPARVGALLGEAIVKVSFGWGHTLALSKDGKLFGWGYYADGRLGKIGKLFEVSPMDAVADKFKSNHPNRVVEPADKLVLEAMEKEKDMPIIWEPTLIEEVRDVEVIDIASGLDHSLILCRDGTILSGGSNVYAQLGRSKLDLGLHPVELNLFPVSISCGLGHSMAICEEAEKDTRSVISWGWNQSSQLGREGQHGIPLAIVGLSGEMPVAVSGGRAHSVVVTGKKQVWSWGCGRNGRLGLGCSVDEAEPVLVEYLEDYKVLEAVSGFDHTLVLVAE